MMSHKSMTSQSVSRLVKRYGISSYTVMHSSIRSTATSVRNPPDTSYANFLKHSQVEPPKLNLHRKTFDMLDAQDTAGITKEQMREVPWSSNYDGVTRSPFAKDVAHLRALLDALIWSKNFDRAHNILKAMCTLLPSSESFSHEMNKYLEGLSKTSASHTQLEKEVSEFENLFSPKVRTDRTYAILLSASAGTNEFNDYVQTIKNNVLLTRRVLGHVDLLDFETITKILKNKAITKAHVPEDLMPIFNKVIGVPDAEMDEFYDTVPPVEKDAANLTPVDTFGLKVIRHTLLGLSSDPKSAAFRDFFKHLEENIGEHILHGDSANKQDYFKMYSSLKTQEEKDAFDRALDQFNSARQRSLEANGVEAAKEKWKHGFEMQKKRGDFNLHKSLNAHLYSWYTKMLQEMKKEFEMCHTLMDKVNRLEKLTADEKLKWKEKSHYAPYLTLLSPEKVCVLAMLEMMKLVANQGNGNMVKVAKAFMSVGRALETEFRSQKLIEEEQNVIKKSRSSAAWNKMLNSMKRKQDPSASPANWTNSTVTAVGAVAVSYFMHVAEVPVQGTDPNTLKVVRGMAPALHHTYQFINGQRVGVLKSHRTLVHWLGEELGKNSVQPQLLPMLVQPRPWEAYNVGGYLYSYNSLIRSKDSPEITAYLKKASENNSLDQVFQGLNVLGNTPWTINRAIFDVISHYWNSGKTFHDIPGLEDSVEFPDPVAEDADPAEKFVYASKYKKANQEMLALRSQRCDINYKLEIARGFIGEKIFFPHNLDFRGRAYPLSPHLNHLGGDLSRSLFLFWKGKKLGEHGYRWLKIHLANVYGVDKLPFDQRVKFVEDNMDNIIDSAENPINGNRWWTQGEKPWQVLTVCFELAKAFKMSDPAEFVSHIPVHQDGTCNGLQHYAALGGDVEGARQVNLLPAERPQDVYMHVAKLLQVKVDEDAANGDELAKFLQDKITRKVVKQTVMTNVYGVTYIGAVAQIERQIEHHYGKDEEKELSKAANYLAREVLLAVRQLFEGAHNIQDWLGECAKRISKSVRTSHDAVVSGGKNRPDYLSSVIWTTPLGLPCVQPYRALQREVIKTNLQCVTITDPLGTTPVDARKQQVAFTPNFVHSLDATHMLMTARKCGESDIAFASVHDSYWTHACDVPTMNHHIREQFVALHEVSLVSRLKEEFEERYMNSLQVVNVPNGHPLLDKIKAVKRKWAKKNGKAMVVADEIHAEGVRQEHLESKNPQHVEIGEKMETTVSVTEEYDLYEILNKVSSQRSTPVLTRLKFPEVPGRGSLDVLEVRNSNYFFS